jgi:hypothetical protein
MKERYYIILLKKMYIKVFKIVLYYNIMPCRLMKDFSLNKHLFLFVAN